MQLFEHQKEGITFLKEKSKAILADEMGLGKTRQAIIAAFETTKGGIVLCPASLKTNWAREILIVDPEANIEIADATATYAYHTGDDQNSKWYIVNYDIADRERVENEINHYMPTTLILDEAHYIKSSTTIRTKAALRYADTAVNVYLLTGTPILNRPMELYTLLQAIDHPVAFTTTGEPNWYGYAKKYCGAFRREFWRVVKDRAGRVVYENGRPLKRKMSFLDTSGASNLDDLAEKLKTSYLRRTKDILGDKLPAKIIDNTIVELSPEHRKAYNSAWDDYITYLKNTPEGSTDVNLGNIDLARHIIELNKLKQAASKGKIPHVVEAATEIIENGEKVIIFTQYKETLAQIVAELKARKIKGVKLSGEDNAERRQTAVDYFQNKDEIKVFVANIKAGGVGLTLTAASTVLFADMEWTPALHSQAEDRAHRIGQTRLVNIHYFIAKDTVDEDIVELLGKKQQVINKVLAGEAGTTRDITKDAVKRIMERAHVIHNMK